RLAHHGRGPGVQSEAEIIGDAVAQALGLADIDDAVGRIPEEVDAAGVRDVCAAGPPGRIVSHRPIVGAVRLAPMRFGLLENWEGPLGKLGRNGRVHMVEQQRTRAASAGRRAAIAVVTGLVAGAATARLVPWQAAIPAGWSVAALVYVA